MKKWIIAIIIIAALVGGFIGLQRYNAQKAQEEMLANLQVMGVEYDTLVATIGATGTVHSNQDATLTWQTSGSVEKVNVQVGDVVSVDQELATLAQTSLPQSVILAQADLVSAQKALDDLLNSQLQQAQALQSVENAQQALDDLLNPELQQALALQAIADAEKSVDYYETRLRNLKTTASQADIEAAEAQVVLLEDTLDKAKEKYKPYESKPEDNLTRANLLSQVAAAQQQYDAAVRNLNALKGVGSETDIAVAQANLVTAEAQLQDAQRQYERVKDGPNPADVALAEAQLADAQREWERLKDGADPDDILVAESRVAAAQATLDQIHITTPFAGVVTMVDVKPGDQVSPGTVAFRIDDFTRLLVDLEVSEVDINQIQIGQEVTLTFDAILAKEYLGKVMDVALVGNKIQEIVSFTVTVEILDADKDVKPGMTSAVNIVINQLEDTLLVPNRAVRVVNGERVVYLLKQGGSLESVTITLGASSGTYSEVVAGDIQAGDQVVLNPPNSVFQSSGGPMGGPPGGMGN
jgi:HlyD family secretion protein